MKMAPLYALLGGLVAFALGWLAFLTIQQRQGSRAKR